MTSSGVALWVRCRETEIVLERWSHCPNRVVARSNRKDQVWVSSWRANKRTASSSTHDESATGSG